MTAPSIIESPEMVQIFAKPGHRWEPAEMRVVEWVLEERQYRYLLHFVLYHLHVEAVNTPEVRAKNAEDAWHDFYLRHFDKVAQSYSPAVAFPLFDATDLELSTQLVATLRQRQDALNDYVREQLRPPTRQLLMTAQDLSGDHAPWQHMLAEDLNRMLQGDCIYTEERFITIRLRPDTRRYLGQIPQQLPPTLLNRLLLEDAYPGVFVRRRLFGRYNRETGSPGALTLRAHRGRYR